MASTTETAYRGTDKLVFGIVLAVLNFWLFAQTTLNVAPATRDGGYQPVALQVLPAVGKMSGISTERTAAL